MAGKPVAFCKTHRSYQCVAAWAIFIWSPCKVEAGRTVPLTCTTRSACCNCKKHNCTYKRHNDTLPSENDPKCERVHPRSHTVTALFCSWGSRHVHSLSYVIWDWFIPLYVVWGFFLFVFWRETQAVERYDTKSITSGLITLHTDDSWSLKLCVSTRSIS